MKKAIALVTVLICLSVAVNAQGKRDTIRSDKHNSAKEKRTDELGLSKEQSKKWKEEKASFKNSRDALKADKSLSPEQRKQKEEELHQQHVNKLNSILTPEQQAKYKSMREEEKEERQEKKKEMGQKKGSKA